MLYRSTSPPRLWPALIRLCVACFLRAQEAAAAEGGGAWPSTHQLPCGLISTLTHSSVFVVVFAQGEVKGADEGKARFRKAGLLRTAEKRFHFTNGASFRRVQLT